MSGLTPAEESAYADSVARAEAGRARPLSLEAPRRGKPPLHWADLDADQRLEAIARLGVPRFRAEQLSRHLFDRLEPDPAGWTDIPKAERGALAERFVPSLLERVRDQRADSGTTLKTLWRLYDGSLVESVLMRYGVPGIRASGPGRDRATVCVSSQAGCGMACPFCATGQGGLRRNLSTAEILGQVMDAARRLRDGEIADRPGRVSNVVFMGMGEPMANFAAVLRAVRTIVDPVPTGLGISARGITVSTVGLVPQIRRLADAGLPVTLAISLHAPDDALRDQLCPVNTRWNIDQVVAAARDYFAASGRRVSIEYALIRDVNDQTWRADALADLLCGPGGASWAHVNLIPLNPTPGSRWTASSPSREAAFLGRLAARGVPVTIRDTRGREVDGACGQLAAQRG